jgi:hypothetical protein
MRTLSMLCAGALAAGSLLLASTPAEAFACPPLTKLAYKEVAGRQVAYCVPNLPGCDPAACDVVEP